MYKPINTNLSCMSRIDFRRFETSLFTFMFVYGTHPPPILLTDIAEILLRETHFTYAAGIGL